jgi:CheY-like chemotaxis protein
LFEPTENPQSGDGRAVRVLIVDDHRDSAEFFGFVIEESGHQVRIVHDAESAISSAREFLPDFVILDIGLPNADGIEVAQRIRNESLKKVRIVAVSGYGRPETIARAKAAGIDMYLVKPVVPDTLLQALTLS